MSTGPIQDQIDALTTLGPLKVWSVVITIMGDLCRTPDDRISGRALDLLTTRMGITNQALRVALHRLKRDGWIGALRDGRVSTYALTPLGRERTEAVRPLIYAHTPAAAEPVYLILAAPQSFAQDLIDDMPEGAVFLTPRIALATGPAEGFPADSLTTPLDPIALPDWVRDGVADDALRRDYAKLTSQASLPQGGAPLDRAVIRLLAFHHYRRLRLRHGPLPDLILGATWDGARCRQAVMALLAACPRPSLTELQKAADAPLP